MVNLHHSARQFNAPDKICLPLLVGIRARITTQAELLLSQYPTE
ncbi:hypothetical protein [Xenorhabdus bovienii]|nr:hypothetical protein [Xenorhabdus bovienii]